MALRFFFIEEHKKSFVIVFSRDSLSTLRIVHNFFCHSNYNIASTFSILEKVVLHWKYPKSYISYLDLFLFKFTENIDLEKWLPWGKGDQTAM